jgi:hypothetical protein
MCYILCMSSSVERMHWARRGVQRPVGGSGANAPNFFFCIGTTLYLGGFSAHGFFADGFLFRLRN